METKKIVHVCLQGYIEGSGYQESILARCHKRMGLDVYVIAASNDGGKTHSAIQQQYINDDGINVTLLKQKSVKGPKPYRLLFHTWTEGIYNRLQEISPDYIFVHGGGTRESYDIVRYIKNNPSVKAYADSHSDYYNTPVDNSLKDKLLRWWINKPIQSLSKHVIKFWGVTPWRCDYLEKVFKVEKNKIDLLVMGGDDKYIDTDHKEEIRARIRQQYGIDEKTFLVVSGGRIMAEKNIDILAKAVERIDNAKLLIVGTPVTGYKDAFENSLKGLKKTMSAGWVDSTGVYDYFFAADLVVFPGTHSVLWEQAVAAGTPIVVKRWPGMQHVDVGGNCLFIDEISENAVANAIASISFDTSLYENMKQVASTKAAALFKYSYIAQKAIGLISER